MRLADLAGQERARGALERALRAGRVPHAYLFEGPTGVGKRSAAIALGLALVCPTAPGAGCGGCDACRRVLARNHPDVRTIAAEGTQILMEQIQEVVLLAATRPHEAPARVIVVDEADRMNVASGNALLKTLEEPAPGNHLVLVTAAPDRLLPTIRSRTQRIRFGAVPAAVIVDLLVARGHERARAELAAALSGGKVARALELAGGEGDDGLWEAVASIRRAAAGRERGGEIGAVLDAAAALGDKETKAGLPETLSLLGRFYRDALARAAGADELVLLRERSAEIDAAIGAISGAPAVRRLRRALGAVVEAEEALAGNVNAVTALERLMLELRPCEARGTR